MDMEITKIAENGVITLIINGRIDTTTAPVLEKEILADVKDNDKLVLDFKDVEYISSAGLRVLLSSHKIMEKKGGMTVKSINEALEEIFEVTGFSDILNIE